MKKAQKVVKAKQYRVKFGIDRAHFEGKDYNTGDEVNMTAAEVKRHRDHDVPIIIDDPDVAEAIENDHTHDQVVDDTAAEATQT